MSSLIGSAGVALLLVAFFLNLFGFLSAKSKLYGILNVVGAGLSCYASTLIHFFPFIILEGTWCMVALISLIKAVLAAR